MIIKRSGQVSLSQLLENLKYSIYIYIYCRPIKRSKHRTRMKIDARTTIPIARYINFTPNFTQSFSSVFQACVTELYKHPFENTSPLVHCIAFHEGGEGASSLRTTLAPNFEGLAPGPHPCARRRLVKLGVRV